MPILLANRAEAGEPTPAAGTLLCTAARTGEGRATRTGLEDTGGRSCLAGERGGVAVAPRGGVFGVPAGEAGPVERRPGCARPTETGVLGKETSPVAGATKTTDGGGTAGAAASARVETRACSVWAVRSIHRRVLRWLFRISEGKPLDSGTMRADLLSAPPGPDAVLQPRDRQRRLHASPRRGR
jgi:hypothetical protein